MIYEQRLLPDRGEVRETAPDDDDIHRAFAENLERDADVTASRVADLRNLHRAILIAGEGVDNYMAVSAATATSESVTSTMLRLSVRARAPVERPPRAPLPARPFGAQYPIASKYLSTPVPDVYETDPGETCERVVGTDVPSIIVPPPPGVSAEIRGKQVVVRWSLGTVHGDCPPSELVLSYASPASTIHESVHTASGVTRMRLLDGAPPPKTVTARAVSVDRTKSRAVAVLVRRPS